MATVAERSPSRAVYEWHIVFGGFLQTADSGSVNGTLELWSKLHQKHSGARTVVEWHPWSVNTDALAEKVLQFRNGVLPRVYVYAYSWGGTAAVRFARNLRKRGLFVSRMILSDAVYRHWYWLGQYRAAVSWSRLIVPDNVRFVDWFYQRNPRFSLRRLMTGTGTFFEPAGHQVEAENPAETRVCKGIELPQDHCHMDNADAWHAMAVGNGVLAHDE